MSLRQILELLRVFNILTLSVNTRTKEQLSPASSFIYMCLQVYIWVQLPNEDV